MKRITITLCAATLLIACQNKEASQQALIKSETETTTPAQPDSATMMKNWEEYMTAGAPHKMMASWNGEWIGAVTMWMAPDVPPSKGTGTTSYRMIMDGRYQLSETKGDFGGMPLEGMSTLAYDNHKQKFISTWIDNFGTGVMVLEGPWDEATKTMTLTGKMMDPSLKKEVDVKETVKIIDNDHQVMEMYATSADGKEFKTMEISYTRKK
jgi:hypothetical protein